jgi:hypothetical protein
MEKFLKKIFKKVEIKQLTYYIKKNFFIEYLNILDRTYYLPKNCKFTERVFHIINNLTEPPKCTCGKNLPFLGFKKGYQKHCSSKCYGADYKSKEKRKKTCLKKYKIENISQLKKTKDKIKSICLQKYGKEYILQVLKFRENGKKTRQRKYGDENYNNREKYNQTICKIYGTENLSFLQLPEIRTKIKITVLKNQYMKIFKNNKMTNITPLFSLEEYNGTKNKKYSFLCNICKNKFESYLDDGHIPRCYHCYPIDRFTIPHKIICEYLKNKNIQFGIEKYIKPYFVDIFIEPNKVIEIYGDYWHGNPKFYKEGEFLNLPTAGKF